MPVASRPPPLLELRGVSRRYPGVLALDRVDFTLERAEVHVLFGENGAGKSTLISLLAGVRQPSDGEILIDGDRVRFESVHAARAHGISAVFQEFSLIPQLSVEENLFLGEERSRFGLLRGATQRREARRILDELDFALDPTVRVDRLTRAEQQMVEIAKAFRSGVSVLILDEPTASLTDRETDQLFALVQRLRGDGVGIVYITHRMAEIKRIGDRVTVLRDGRLIATVAAESTSEAELVNLMTGREVGELFPDVPCTPGAVRLRAVGLRTRDGRVRAVSFDARGGEILGLAGLVGSGKSEALQACFGARPLAAGRVSIDGRVIDKPDPAALLAAGMLYLPADRHRDGLMLMRSVRENIAVPVQGDGSLRWGPFVNPWAEIELATRLSTRLELSPPGTERAVNALSGGNQQKVMLARSLAREFRIIVFDEPTVGVDVGTRTAIYAFIAELCAAGVAIVLISSDLPEILNLAHRCLVFHNGRIQAELEGEAIDEATVLSYFFERESVEC